MNTYISPRDLCQDLEIRDLSDPAKGQHSMQALLSDVINSLETTWNLTAETIRVSPVVAVEDNYDRLGFDPNAITRDRKYSRYLGPTVMLRSHTSASIPWLLRNQVSAGEIYNRFVALPGLVYRRDAIDRTHVGTPHQVDLWRMSSRTVLDDGDLESMVATVVEAVLPGATWRSVPNPHPYTRSGRQIDVHVDGEWLELAECGLVADHVFERTGLDPTHWSGLALGMGLDRALMLRKGIDDIRLLRADDPRIAQQMLDLEPWRPVSMNPPVRRDLSIVLDEHDDVDVLGDQVRRALGDRADDLESVDLRDVTPYDTLPASARERLQLKQGQVNALVRVVLRPLATTFTDAEANALRDAIYLAIHKGPVLEMT